MSVSTVTPLTHCVFHSLNHQKTPSLTKDLEKSCPDLIQSFGFVYSLWYQLGVFLFLEKIHSLLSDSDPLGKYLEDKTTGRVCPGVKKTSMTEPKMLYACCHHHPLRDFLPSLCFPTGTSTSIFPCLCACCGSFWNVMDSGASCATQLQCQFQNSTSKSIFQVSLLCPVHHSMQVRTFFLSITTSGQKSALASAKFYCEQLNHTQMTFRHREAAFYLCRRSRA